MERWSLRSLILILCLILYMLETPTWVQIICVIVIVAINIMMFAAFLYKIFVNLSQKLAGIVEKIKRKLRIGKKKVVEKDDGPKQTEVQLQGLQPSPETPAAFLGAGEEGFNSPINKKDESQKEASRSHSVTFEIGMIKDLDDIKIDYPDSVHSVTTQKESNEKAEWEQDGSPIKESNEQEMQKDDEERQEEEEQVEEEELLEEEEQIEEKAQIGEELQTEEAEQEGEEVQLGGGEEEQEDAQIRDDEEEKGEDELS
eukprot:CAMPEP_0176412926 /NCGR_PEP_ID=MMETSP0127-20121128/4410_1 /TAXON_ID=938130 /ORGANISM="Platyophrya macrostoma, Strain WH" /LENGTH=256 /DNA_ID=CAMNT_0017792641 /DNA_START=102 /DNA_END=869 /DNA_ORIENTATION=+